MITEKVEFEYVYGNQPTEELVSTLLIEETVNFELDYTIGEKQYELSNHLGNVLAVISDWKVPVISGASVVSYTTVVVSSQDYSPFGVTLEGRSWSVGYRYGFQNQETDDEMWGGAISFKYRVEDARLGRFFSVDPLGPDYPWNSTYAFSENRLLDGVELEGLEFHFIAGGGNGGKSKLNYAMDFQIRLGTKIGEFKRVNCHAPADPTQLSNTASDAYFALHSIWARTPVNLVKNQLTDYRIVECYKQLNQSWKDNHSSSKETNKQFNVCGYSFGSVVGAQATIMLMMNNPDARIDNLILIGSPIDLDGQLYKELEKCKSQGRIGSIQYIYSPGDEVVGAAGLDFKERKRIWNDVMIDAATGQDNPHIYFGDDSKVGEETRQCMAEEINENCVEN
jgi:RHS repeat-associated protein